MKKIKMSLVAAIAAAAATTGANAGALDSILSNPKLDLELRPRYEYVDQDGFTNEANAFTVRTALGAQFGLANVDGLGAQIQMMNVANFGQEDYNSLSNGNATYPVVADPDQTRVTQANISYAKNGFVGIVGRKMVVLDNARFIGNVGWRQMPQTYDLAAAIYNGVKNLSLLGAFVNRVHTIKDNGQFDTSTVLLHATYKVMPQLTLTAYDYMVASVCDHIGLRATGKVNAGAVKVAYEAEYAMQNDATLEEENLGKPNQDADYYKIGASASISGFTFGAAYEVLSGTNGTDGKTTFITPLATLHAMNGWADKFLSTPTAGLTDASVKLAYNAGKAGNFVAIYHKFESDVGSTDYGTEIDAAYKFKINKNLGLLLKGAWYDADQYSVDTTKYWVQLDYKFSAKL
ncbi:hypothetical protein RZR97_02030 [Hydrogenimonas thermophila]|uniref:hypothetical protein n=1 Tax=Hydrogenimonas thermophila TaxID=223786 RepID=UPI0029372E9B|nr:hypothetical protein [Hydrogenimonas thermophila]WOE70364.1 hypothetical protein RZR91_02050 [Hydrogenimonas thermophila]WOE72879.1 hypothetical protein RZR97_02030 [Hydrogenimonas thermophila]